MDLQPGNGTRYHLMLAVGDSVNIDGRTAPLSVVWVDRGTGWVFDLNHSGVLVPEYTADKLGGSIADGWVLGRWLTALRLQVAALTEAAA